MNVKTKSFARFLNLIGLKGGIENTSVLAEGDAKKISVSTVLPNSVMAYKGSLGGCFDKLGKVGIDDIPLLKKFTNMFSEHEEIDLKLDNNKLTITTPQTKPTKKTRASAILRDPSLVRNILPEEKFVSIVSEAIGNEFILKKEVQKEIIKHFEAIGAKELRLKGKDNELILELENNQNELVVSFDLEEKVSDFKVVISQIFIDLLSVLDADVKVSMKTDTAIYLILDEENIYFEYLIAPKVK